MPAPLDKDKVRIDIIKAFQKCAGKKPLPQVSLRDVAKEMNVSHGSILYYFKNKDELLVACSRWAGRQFCDMIAKWFESNQLSEFASESVYLDSFLATFMGDESNEAVPRAVVITCVMGDYSEDLKADIKYECDRIKQQLKQSIEKSTARKLRDAESQAILMLLMGVYFCAFNGVMGEYGSTAFSCMKGLMKTTDQVI